MATSGESKKRKATNEVGPSGITHIRLKIRSQDGRELFFKVSQDAKLERVFTEFCNRVHMEYHSTRFVYDGSYVNGKRQTPKQLNLEHDAEILATRYQSGGGVASFSFSFF